MRDKIIDIIADQLSLSSDDKAAIMDSTELKDDLGVDSLDFVELCMGLEEAFDIEISDPLWEKVVTIQDVVLLTEDLV